MPYLSHFTLIKAHRFLVNGLRYQIKLMLTATERRIQYSQWYPVWCARSKCLPVIYWFSHFYCAFSIIVWCMFRAMITLEKGPVPNDGNVCADCAIPQTADISLRENNPVDSQKWRVDDLLTIFQHRVLMDVNWNTLYLNRIQVSMLVTDGLVPIWNYDHIMKTQAGQSILGMSQRWGYVWPTIAPPISHTRHNHRRVIPIAR